jgi:hypothetical protein
MFENRILRRIFGPKRVEITRECVRLYKDKLRTQHKILFESSNQEQ